MQSLADNDPDVDGMYRLSSKLPVTFLHKAAQRAIPPFVFTPFNAQAVLFDRSAVDSVSKPEGRGRNSMCCYLSSRSVCKNAPATTRSVVAKGTKHTTDQ